MSDEHKAALARGRTQGKAVREYLDALAASQPKRGRKRTPESIETRLAAIADQITTADPLKTLQLTQERMDLEAELANLTGDTVDLEALEAEFVKHAKDYGESKGLVYAAWREVGVPPATLKKAGIGR